LPRSCRSRSSAQPGSVVQQLNVEKLYIEKFFLVTSEPKRNIFESLSCYHPVRKSIEAKYMEVEKALIEEFVRHHRSDDKEKMAELALILSHFRRRDTSALWHC
jgi:hypothetical protein